MVLKYVSILDKKTGKCVAVDRKVTGFTEKDVTLNIFDNFYYLTDYLKENKEYQLKLFNQRKKEKYQEITNAYDRSCNYGVCPINITENQVLYGNRAWLGTWQEAIAGLEFTKGTAFVRLYEKCGDLHLKNVTIENVTSDQYKALYLQLINFRFNTLQPIRNSLYEALELCKKVEDIEALVVDFKCMCVDEQNDIEGIIILNTPEEV